MEAITKNCISCGKRVSVFILMINIFLVLFKAYFAIVSYSDALFADAFESLNNVIITIIVLISLWITEKGENEKFPYGYGRVEFIASSLANFLLVIASLGFLYVSVQMTIVGREIVPKPIAIFAAAVAFFLNQIAFHYGKCPGEKLKSPAILANTRANKLDAYTTLVVMIAVIASNLGIPRVDHLAAILIGLIIAYEALEGMILSVRELMGIPYRDEEQKIKYLVSEIKGVRCVNSIKSRSVGRKIWIDIEIALERERTIKEGLIIIRNVKDCLAEKLNNINEVSVQLVSERTF